MINPQVPNDDEDEAMKKMIQERFKSMFSGENDPLTEPDIRQVEVLKVRVAALEARLAINKLL
jgi:hypothetical protein